MNIVEGTTFYIFKAQTSRENLKKAALIVKYDVIKYHANFEVFATLYWLL